MATPFSRQLMSFEDLEKELHHFGKSNISALQKYAVSTPTTAINDDNPAEGKDMPFDTTRALSLQPKIEVYENSNFIKRWWLWWSTDISSMHTAYYYARATLILKTLNQKQPLSPQEHQIITQGVHQHSRFSALGSIYRALNNATQLSNAVRTDQASSLNVSSANATTSKPSTTFDRILNWLGFNSKKTTIEVNTATTETNKNPMIMNHAKFNSHFQEYKTSLMKTISDLVKMTPGNQASLYDAKQLRIQLDDLKKNERRLMLMTHPDKNPGDYQATASANFQRLQSFIDWKTNILGKIITDIENITSLGHKSTVSITLLQPSFNTLNECDEKHNKEIEQLLLDKQRMDVIAEKIKKQYDLLRNEHRIKAEAARKVSQGLNDLIHKLDAENAELRKNAQLRKMAMSLQTPHKQQEAHIDSANNDVASSPAKPTSTPIIIDDDATRPYFKTSKSVTDGSLTAQENHTTPETLTPIS